MNTLSSLDEIEYYRSKHIDARLIIDTNVLLLLLVGLYDQDYLSQCSLMTRNGKCYGKGHFELLNKILQRFVYRILITPQVLAEIYSLSHKAIKPPRFDAYFVKILQSLKTCQEHHVPLDLLLEARGILQFGFTDMSLVEAAAETKSAILTDEFDLHRTFKEQIPVISFSNVIAREIMI